MRARDQFTVESCDELVSLALLSLPFVHVEELGDLLLVLIDSALATTTSLACSTDLGAALLELLDGLHHRRVLSSLCQWGLGRLRSDRVKL